MEEAIKKNTSTQNFASDIKEGTKLYNGQCLRKLKIKEISSVRQ